MTEYALVGPNGEIKTTSSSVDPNVSTREGWSWLPLETVPPPAMDATVQVLDGPVITVLADKVTRSWSVRAKTVQEIDTDKTAALDRVDTLIFKILFNQENRIRALEGKTAVSVVQFRSALKAMP